MKNSDIKSIEVGIFCCKTIPCVHDVTITYQNNTKQTKQLNAVEIVSNFEDYLTPEYKEHFADVKNLHYPYTISSRLFIPPKNKSKHVPHKKPCCNIL